MPDDDRIGRRLAPPWRKVLTCLRGREPIDRTEDLVASALASTLRATGGVPELKNIAANMHRTACGDGGGIGGSPRPAPDHAPTRAAEKLARVLVVTLKERLALTSPDSAALLFAQELLKNLAHGWGFDRMVHELIEDEGYDALELQSRIERILQGEQLEKLAKRLLARPTAQGLRAPNRRTKPIEHDDLLETNLDDI